MRITASKVFRYLLLAVVLLGIALSVYAFTVVLNYFQLTPHQFVSKGLDKAGIKSPWLQDLIAPDQRYAGNSLDGEIVRQHPRILLPELRGWDSGHQPAPLASRDARYLTPFRGDFTNCSSPGGLLPLVSCWLSTGNKDFAEQAIRLALDFRHQLPNVNGEYGDLWELALAYDLLSIYPQLSNSDRIVIEEELQRGLVQYLALLDEDSPSLWHGRTTLAAYAWLIAVVLDGQDAKTRALQVRAQGHFLVSIRALELTEGWPEGYNYWINTRAFPLALAASAYIRGLQNAVKAERVKQSMVRVGLWTLYATRPDNRIEGIGDEGPRVDLKDESRRVIDLIAQITHRSEFVLYSSYLESLHGKESYYRDYRWGFRLFNDPGIPLAGLQPSNLSIFSKLLPLTALFGRDAMNQVYIRSGWKADDTFISFRAGQNFTHHGHYDAGHFSIFKGAPLAINSSTYGDFNSENRLYYSIRTVAKNSLLVLRPDEKVQAGRSLPENVAEGGQRITLPTGSAITSVEDFGTNLGGGRHLEGGRLLRYEHVPDQYSYLAADLTAAYNNTRHDKGGWGGKVRKVVRELFYSYPDDRLLVHDVVESTEAGYTKKWLLHTVNRPQVSSLRTLVGSVDNGILESASDMAQVNNGKGYLQVQRLLPAGAVMRLVGGTDYRYYVEADGDDSDLDGRNFAAGAASEKWFDIGNWRIEIQPSRQQQTDEFLVALTPSFGVPRVERLSEIVVKEGKGSGVVSGQSAVVFVPFEQDRKLVLDLKEEVRILFLCGVPPLGKVTVTLNKNRITEVANSAGVVRLVVPVTVESRKVTLSWSGGG